MKIIFIIIVMLCVGCMNIKRYDAIKTDVNISSVNIANIESKQRKISEIINQTKLESSKYIGLQIEGKISIRDCIQVIFTAMDVDYVVIGEVSGNVDMKVTSGTTVSLINLMGYILYESGYQMGYKDGYIIVSSKESPVLYEIENKVWSIKVIEVQKNIYDNFIELLKNFDKSVMDNVKIIKGSENRHILMFTSGYNIQVVDLVLARLNEISELGLYIISLRSREAKEIAMYIDKVYSDEKYIIDTSLNSIVVFQHETYKKINELVRLIDKEQYQFMLTLYLLDVNQSEKLNFGADINFQNNSLSFTTALRESVGLGVAGYVDDLSLTANYLVQEYSGRVLVNPRLYLRNGASSSFAFGQQVPTLTSKASVSSDIIQSVGYVSTGVNVSVTLQYMGGNVQVKMSVTNSSVLESVGVEGNPLFSNDTVSFDYVQGIGKTAILAGFKRIEQSNSRNKHLIPFLGSFFKKEEKREYVILSKIDLVNIVENDISIETLN